MTDYIDLEEKLISDNEKKHRKHYLNPNAKAFIHKILRVFNKSNKK